jgi:hypothetical protein
VAALGYLARDAMQAAKLLRHGCQAASQTMMMQHVTESGWVALLQPCPGPLERKLTEKRGSLSDPRNPILRTSPARLLSVGVGG